MSSAINHSDRLSVPASTDHLSTIRDFIRVHASSAGFNDFDENNIVLAVDEACANLIQHAYKNDGTKNIELEIGLSDEKFQVVICDTSAPFDPSAAELPDMRRYFAEHRHHGLGILLMTRVMDAVEYRGADNGNGQNTLVLTKQRTA